MIRRISQGRTHGNVVTTAVVTLLVLGFPYSAPAQTTCGPGDHWIDGCDMGGMDSFPNSGAVVGIDTTLEDGNLDGAVDTNLVLFGPTTVTRTGTLDDSANFPGTSPVDGHPTGPGLDVIDTEIVSMSLMSGSTITLTAGGGLGSGPTGLIPSLGTIVERPSDPSLGDSFFDVFFEVGLGGGIFLYNQEPLRIETVIDRVPPDAVYLHVVTSPIPLYPTPLVQPGQQAVAQLVTAQHITMPSALLIPTMTSWGMVAMIVLLLTAAIILSVRRRSAKIELL